MAGLSLVKIANAGLVKIGVPTIVSFDEDSEPATKVSQVYDIAIADEMRKYAWSFALGRASLAALATDGLGWDFANRFQLPSDCLRVVQINDIWLFTSVRDSTQSTGALYRIEGRTIRTDLNAPLKLRYIKDLTADPSLWDAAFASTVASRIAAEVCLSLTGSESRALAAVKAYKEQVLSARRTGALEMPPEVMADGSWIDARFM